MGEVEMLRKKLDRALKARKEAESILEAKALELYEANQSLQALNTSLEDQIEERTQQLVSKEDQFKMVVNNASDIILTVDEYGYFLMVNSTSLKKFGYTEEEILGTCYIDHVREDFKEKLLTFYINMKEKEISESYLEFPIINADGEVVWLGQNVTRQVEGDRVYYSAVARDITEKINNLQELKTVNSRFSALLENLVDGILVEDEDRKVVLSNQAFTQMFNLPVPPEALVGLDCLQLAVDAAGFFVEEASFVTRIEEILEKQEIVTNEEMISKDGRIFSRNFIPVSIDGHTQGTLWYYADITQRRNRELIIKRSEEKYRGILESMDLGILEVDADGVIIRVYESFNKLTGYEGNELIGRSEDILLVEEFRELLEEQYSIRRQGNASAYEMRIKRKDQSEIWVLVSGAPIYDESGKVIGSIGLHYDLTARKKLEQDLVIAREEAVNAQQAEKQFLASMSHEIRTPLNAIIGMTHLLGDTELQQDQSEYLEALSSSASLLKNLISDILDISKIDAGTIDLQEKPVDIRQLSRKLLPAFSLKARDKNISFRLEIEDVIGHTILTDGQLLSQILLNLLSNADKFTEKGSIILSVKLEGETEGEYQLLFSVKDTGIGMNAFEVSLVFDKFTQANPTISNKYGGTGLGLSISRRLVKLLGGELKVKSAIGVGSDFYFSLRVKKGPALEPTTSYPINLKYKKTSFKGQSALVVEDNEMNIKYISTLMRKWEVSFQVVRNGQEAITKFKENEYDIIFMDLQMPVMNGFDASVEIRTMGERGRTIPIVALTASTFLSKKQLAMKAGFSDFISKPFTPDQLLDVAAKYLSSTAITHQPPANLAFTPRLNHAYLKEVYGDDVDYAHDMFCTFLEVIDREFDYLQAALKAEDVEEIKRLIHKITPTFSMVGLSELTRQFNELGGNVEEQSVTESREQTITLRKSLDAARPLLLAEKTKLSQLLKIPS